MFANFIAHGMVREINNETTQNGNTGVSLVIKTGEWQGQQGMQEDLLRVTIWGNRAQMAQGVNVGDSVAVSGRVKSKLNQRGYWNDSLQVSTLMVTARGQQQGGYQQPMQQQPMQQPMQQQMPAQNAYADDDIPF